jgi:hypothetical protein
MGELRKQARAYKPTPEDIGRLILLTRKEMIASEITNICPNGCCWADILEERRLASEARRIANRRKKRAEQRAAMAARPRREQAVLVAIERQRRLGPVTVAHIAARVRRYDPSFPRLKDADLKRAIHRILDRLEVDGVLKSLPYGGRNQREIWLRRR